MFPPHPVSGKHGLETNKTGVVPGEGRQLHFPNPHREIRYAGGRTIYLIKMEHIFVLLTS
ncbi:MAG: hypothetical protein COB90_09100 [Hyphomicrobiales bacterium]|nr:MAG: hypothetical protein COB90_09100 [Hyphomicrobiales bacterium]